MHAGAGAVVSQAITFLAIPVIFRLYEPADFAPWAVGLAIVTMVGGISTLRYELAVVVERDHLDASALFWFSLVLALLIGALASSVFAFPIIHTWLFPAVSITLFPPMIAAWLITISLVQAMQGWVLHQGAFLVLSVGQISNAIVMNSVQLIGGQAGGGADWLILGSILGQLTFLLVLVIAVMRSSDSPAPLFSCGERIRKLALRHRKFPLFSVPYTLCTIARERIGVVALGMWVGPTEVGLYSQAWRIMNFPVGLTGGAIRPVLFHSAAKQGLSAQESRVGRILTALVVTGSPWLAIVLFRPNELFGLALGDVWYEAGTYAAVIAIPVFLFALRNWMDRILDVAGRQDLNLMIEFVSATTSIAGLVMMLASGSSVLAAVSVQSFILAINYAFFMFVAYKVAGYHVQILGKLAVTCLVLVAAFFMLYQVIGSRISVPAVLVTAGSVAFIFSSISGWFLFRRLK